MLTNQVIHLIKFGCLQTTKVRVKAVQRIAEKAVTIARKGNDFNTVRRIKKLLPYDEKMVKKLIKEIAPKYVDRPGGYTRVIPLGRRQSDTAVIAASEISIEDDLAKLCQEPQCENYGLSSSCPPHVAGPAGFREYQKNFQQAAGWHMDRITRETNPDEVQTGTVSGLVLV